MLASIIRSNLRIAEGGGEKELNKIVSVSFENLFNLISDETPVVLKSVCEALQLCLPSMVHSTMYNKGMVLLTVSIWSTLFVYKMFSNNSSEEASAAQ